MASKKSNNDDAPVPYPIVLETNNNLIQSPPREYDDFISSLPLKSLKYNSIRQFQGFWIGERFLRGALAMQEHFKPQSNYIFIASYPKSGTTWLKALIFATMTRTKFPLEKNELHIYNPHQCVPFLEKEYALGRRMVLDVIPSPRILNTHIPYSILPDSITSSDCRIVYIWRDPKDVIVSLWHYIINQTSEGSPNLPTFVESFDLFCEGLHYFGSPIWDHIIQYWQESKRNSEKVLFLKYEDMLTDPAKYAEILANFIGRPYSEVEEQQGVIENIVDLCSFGKLKNLDVNKVGSYSFFGLKIKFEPFFRKGMVGDWKNYLTDEMAQKLDNIVANKFKEYGFEVLNENNAS